MLFTVSFLRKSALTPGSNIPAKLEISNKIDIEVFKAIVADIKKIIE